MEGSKRSSSNRCLPDDDLLIEILSKLPVRTLVRFCCVCKFWQSLITSDRCFLRSHLQKNSSKKTTNDKNYRGGCKNVFINPIKRGPACNNVNLYFSRCIEVTDPQGKSFAREINCACRDSRSCRLIFERDNYFNLAGCCDGIICFYVFCYGSGTNLRIYLCNPALNQWRVLPKSDEQTRIWYPTERTKVCFIFDPVSQDYKVIIVTTWETLLQVEIYSLSNNSWKAITWEMPNPGYIPWYSHLVVHNGSPCWITKPWDGAKNKKALNVLDITQEKISEIPPPKCLSIMYYPYLLRYKGYLAISRCWLPNFSFDEIWVMKEGGGASNSWVKQRLTAGFQAGYSGNPPCVTPCATTTWTCLVANGGKVFMADVENERYEQCTSPSKELLDGFSSRYFTAVDYVPSVVSVMPPTS